ncbi:LysR family transcriptional regulator [Actinomycetospora flava]|uniref:LysR family transcriptional regulator n=1 Tax=Actinomycetospora flava TaxID=3129232 RepID=A0ABU8M2P3_9PSEU
MRVEQAGAVLAILRTGSFSAAARELGVGQSTLSEGVRSLERELGAELLRRSRRGVTATTVGQAVRPALERIVAAAEEIADVVAGGGVRRLRIGAVSAAVGTVLADATADLLAAAPGLELRVRAAGSAEIVAGVSSGELDAGLVVVGPEAQDLTLVPLLTCRLGVCVPVGHWLADPDEVDVVTSAELDGERLVAHRPGYRVAELVDALLPDADVVHRADNTETAKAMVAAGVGVAVLPELSLTDADRDALAWRPLHPPEAVTVALVHTAEAGEVVRVFREIVVRRASRSAHGVTP